jgi:hypothetical protein
MEAARRKPVCKASDRRSEVGLVIIPARRGWPGLSRTSPAMTMVRPQRRPETALETALPATLRLSMNP